MIKSLFSFFSLQTLYESKSTFNPDLTVQKYMGKTILYVSQTQQSGPWEERIWSKALESIKKMSKHSHDSQKILILGLGAGNLAKLIRANFPKARITGVEIDSEMVVIGKKFFGLNEISNLKIEIADAFSFLKKEKKKYDLVFVDLFVGQNSPKEIEEDNFLKNLSQTVSKDGVVVFNRLTTKTANFELEKFVDKLSKFMKIDQVIKVDFNSIIFAKVKTN